MAIGIPEELADKIIIYRNGPDGQPGTQDDQTFSDVSTIESVLNTNVPGGLTDEEALVIENLVSNQSLMTTSNYFRIESKGVIDTSHIEKTIVCVVQRNFS